MGDFYLRLSLERMEWIEGLMKKRSGPIPLTAVVPLGSLYVNPAFTKAYVQGTDQKRKKPAFFKLRWVRWFLARPEPIKMAPGG